MLKMSTILCYTQSYTFWVFNMHFLTISMYVNFAWFVKEFRICNIKFQNNFSHRNPRSGLTHSKISDYSSFIYFCGFIYLVINFLIQSNEMSDYCDKESIILLSLINSYKSRIAHHKNTVCLGGPCRLDWQKTYLLFKIKNDHIQSHWICIWGLP